MMSRRHSNTLPAYSVGAVLMLMQLLASFSGLGAIEMPLELLHDGVNVPKSVDYTRHVTFPSQTDVLVEMPPNMEDDNDFTTKGDASDENDVQENDSASQSGIPKWMELHQAHQQPQDHINYHNPIQQQQQHKHVKHHHSNRQVHMSTSSSVSPPLRRCSIEISSKIPGICQSMGAIGNACVSGDYIDVFNAECL